MNPINPPAADTTGNSSTPRPGKTARLAIIFIILVIISGGIAFLLTRPKASSQPAIVNAPAQPTPIQDSVPIEPVADKPAIQAVTTTTEKPKNATPKEVFNPTKYLTSTIKTRKNVVGQAIIGGYITNTSPDITFKDVVLDVSYLSKTGAVISTQRFVVYEIIKPGKKANFKFKTREPAGTKTFSAQLVTAVKM